jgi:hypothetical protein
LVVDMANVMGSRPDGWWRNRAEAAAKLLGEIDTVLRKGALDGPVTVVLEGDARSAARPESTELRVVAASGSGDDAVVAEVVKLVEQQKRVTVVTADHGLQTRVRWLGAAVERSGWLLSRTGTRPLR